MCQLCNGTHVVHTTGSFHTQIDTCPDCGPVPEKFRFAKKQALRKRLEEARKNMSKNVGG
jgi:hydrogenase maturation factor HypF (carbamoyltransferase family)